MPPASSPCKPRLRRGCFAPALALRVPGFGRPAPFAASVKASEMEVNIMYVSSVEQRSRERVQVLADRLYRERYHYLLRIATKNAANVDDAAEAVQARGRARFLRVRLLGTTACTGPGATVGNPANVATVERLDATRRLTWLRRGGCVRRSGGRERALEQLCRAAPTERTALLLFGLGYSYAEIGELNRHNYTKTNRSITEGRATLRKAPA